MSIQFYSVSDSYVEYLSSFDSHVLSNHKADRRYKRPYVGFVFKIKQMDYFIPLSSPGDNDFSNGLLKPSTVTIMRMVNRKGDFIGKILINNMIPVPKSELERIYLRDCDDKYQNLLMDEKNWIEGNIRAIKKNASIVYNSKVRENDSFYWRGGDRPGFLKSTVDFKKLEEAQDSFVKCNHLPI
ncbi:MAG: type III toxin-antitoxin system ToxN/AbiQ family toxin [Bacilli bacterium]|nr:type III toxin-antitoxin system ToxN/AbiQ family toxin [Bacilli bacterium]